MQAKPADRLSRIGGRLTRLARMLTAALLDDAPGVRHAFFSRAGGVSRGPYGSLNCGLGSKDDPAAVEENRSRAMAALGRGGGDLVTLSQIHSVRAVPVTAPFAPATRPEGDALVTATPGLVLGILTADCAPILFVDSGAGVIGACHAGWRGALTGVIEATLAAMETLGADRRSILAASGPCIAQPSYEVGPEFRRRFLEDDPDNAAFFVAGDGDRLHFDLKGYVDRRLARAGIAEHRVEAADTYADEARFFSYRRATKRGEERVGSLLSAIVLEGA